MNNQSRQEVRTRHDSNQIGTPLRHYLLLCLIGLAFLAWPTAAAGQRLRSREDAARVIALEKLSVIDGVVSGAVANRSPHLLRDVELLVRYIWLWDDEYHPGKADPSMSIYHALSREIAPGGTVPFAFSPNPPLPKVSGGRFETTVSIMGYTEIIPQTK